MLSWAAHMCGQTETTSGGAHMSHIYVLRDNCDDVAASLQLPPIPPVRLAGIFAGSQAGPLQVKPYTGMPKELEADFGGHLQEVGGGGPRCGWQGRIVRRPKGVHEHIGGKPGRRPRRRWPRTAPLATYLWVACRSLRFGAGSVCTPLFKLRVEWPWPMAILCTPIAHSCRCGLAAFASQGRARNSASDGRSCGRHGIGALRLACSLPQVGSADFCCVRRILASMWRQGATARRPSPKRRRGHAIAALVWPFVATSVGVRMARSFYGEL